MNQSFINKLVNLDWLVKQFDIIKDINNILRIETFRINKIRECSSPPMSLIIENINNPYFVYNDIVFYILRMNQTRTSCIVDFKQKNIYYAYELRYIDTYAYTTGLRVIFDDLVDGFNVKHNHIYKHTINEYQYDIDTTVTIY